MQVALITLSAALLLTGPQPVRAEQIPAESYTVPDGCRITLIEDVDVPAQEAGVLKELLVREGEEVSENQLLGQIDDQMEFKLKKVAQYKLQVADLEAKNTVSVDYAKAAHAVAKAEVGQAEEANRRHPGTVPPAELNRMLLAREQARLQIKQSLHDLNIAGVSVLVRVAEDEVAALQLERRQIVASLDGVVVERYVDVGEWVQPGDPVLRIIRINRVRLEGFVDASQVLPYEIDGQEVTVRLNTRRWGPISADVIGRPIKGRVVSASPEVEGGRFLVQAEVDNLWIGPDGNVWAATDPARPKDGYWLLRPGLTADMEISLRRIGPPTQTASAQGP